MRQTENKDGAPPGARYYPFPRVLDVLLRGAGQVMFQNSPWTGLLFLLGIAWGSWQADRPEIITGALTGLCTGTLAACLLHAPREEIDAGLHGYNGILVGCALPVFFGSGPLCWALVFAGAFFSTVIMMAVSVFLRSWKVSAMTGPFVFTTWFILLSSYGFSHISIAALPSPALPSQISGAMAMVPGPEALLKASLAGISQVFLIDNAVTGVIFLAGIAASSLPAALLGWAGSVLAMATALFLGADGRSVEEGLYQFSAVLTAIGLGSTFYSPGWRVMLYAFLGTVFTVVAQGALNAALSPLGIPTLTFPFVIAAWLFLLPHIRFEQKGSGGSPSA